MAIIDFENLPSTNTPVNSTNLNSMQSPDIGSNANGYYIKYNNGALIQYGTIDKTSFVTNTDTYTTTQGINIYRSAGHTINFPINFVDTNYTFELTPVVGFSNQRLYTTRTDGIYNAGAEIQLMALESFTSSGGGYNNLKEVRWLAIGRWK